MPTAKKDKSRPKREPKPARTDDSDDDDDDDTNIDEPEEEVENPIARKKREKSRAAFMKLCRQLLSLVPLAMVLLQQPFLVKPRAPGVNRAKVVPLTLAVSGAVLWAKDSPTTLRNPAIARHLNTTARALLTPHELYKAYSSKRAMDSEKTFASAFKKSEKTLARVAAAEKDIALQPMPNFPLIGAALVVVGALFMWLIPGAEYLLVFGCAGLMQGTRTLGMEAQPDLYVAGAIAVICITMMDAAKIKGATAAAKRKKRK